MKAKRNPRLIRTIRQAIKELGLKEYEYRGIYKSATGKESISGQDGRDGMTDKELGRVIEALKKAGFNPAQPRADLSRCVSPQARKIRSLWLTLKDLGVLRDSSEKALLIYIRKRTGVERMEWMQPNQLQYITETLKAWVEREEAAKAGKRAAESALTTTRMAALTAAPCIG